MTDHRSRRELIALTAAGAIGLLSGFRGDSVAASPLPGDPCTRKGRIRKVGKRTFVCRERAGALVWVIRKGGQGAATGSNQTVASSVPAMSSTDLVLGVPKIVIVTDGRGTKKYVGFTRTSSGIVAFEPKCTHQGYQLETRGSEWYCDYHGSRFNGESGAVTAGPARTSLRRYPTDERSGTIYVTI
jgi:nitrite reductase/ring-hydroxylating ferredoxin subunit